MHILYKNNITDPVLLDTGMYATKCRWNHDGSILAIVGSTVLIGENKETNVIQFFSAFGEVRLKQVICY